MNPVFYILGTMALAATVFIGLVVWANWDLLSDKKQTHTSNH